MLVPLGLGRIWYEKRSPGCDEEWCQDKRCRHKKDWKGLRDGIAGYISKYITKTARGCRTWGVMRKRLEVPSQQRTQLEQLCKRHLQSQRTSLRLPLRPNLSFLRDHLVLRLSGRVVIRMPDTQ